MIIIGVSSYLEFPNPVSSPFENFDENYKKYKPNIKPCKRKDILKNLNFKIAKDSSMNLSLLKKIKRRNGQSTIRNNYPYL